MKKKETKEFYTTVPVDDDHRLEIDYDVDPTTIYTVGDVKFSVGAEYPTTEYTSSIESSELSSQPEEYVTTVSYRGYDVPVYLDDYGQCYYCKFDGEEISFGTYNTNYLEDIYYLVDEKLDVIHRFKDEFFGAQLKWFDNGGHRDIKLVYRLRVIKVWLVEIESQVKVEKLIEESKTILAKLIKHVEN